MVPDGGQVPRVVRQQRWSVMNVPLWWSAAGSDVLSPVVGWLVPTFRRIHEPRALVEAPVANPQGWVGLFCGRCSWGQGFPATLPRDPHLCAAHERLFLSAVIPSGCFQSPGGCTNEMFSVCLGDHEPMLLVPAVEGDFVSAELPVCIFRAFKSARMTALQNGTGGVSSIATGSATTLSRQFITGRGNSLRAFQFPSSPLGQELMVCCVNCFRLGSSLEVGAYDREH